jgi:hypothetical protein
MNRTATSEELKALIAAHAAEIAALKVENEKLVQRVVHLEEQLRLERLHRYAPRSEKLTERIFNEAEQAAAEDEEADDVEAAPIADTGLPDAEEPEPKKRGRKPLPDDLPRERVEHDLPEDQKVCPCCLNRMHRMGEAVSEQLHIEVKAVVLQHVRCKYACRHCERTALHTPIVIAPMPAQPLPGSVATPSTLALVLANKYVVQIGIRSVGHVRYDGRPNGRIDGLSVCGRPQARRLRRPASRLRGLTSPAHREPGINAVDRKSRPPTPRQVWTWPTLSG